MLDWVELTVIICSERQFQSSVIRHDSSEFPQSSLFEPLPVSLLAGSCIDVQARTTGAAGRFSE